MQNLLTDIVVFMAMTFIVPDLLGYILVRVSNNPDVTEHSETEECARWAEATFPADTSETLDCSQVRYGQYVSIQRTFGDGGLRTQLMILCEVFVLGAFLSEFDRQLLFKVSCQCKSKPPSPTSIT